MGKHGQFVWREPHQIKDADLKGEYDISLAFVASGDPAVCKRLVWRLSVDSEHVTTGRFAVTGSGVTEPREFAVLRDAIEYYNAGGSQ